MDVLFVVRRSTVEKVGDGPFAFKALPAAAHACTYVEIVDIMLPI